MLDVDTLFKNDYQEGSTDDFFLVSDISSSEIIMPHPMKAQICMLKIFQSINET